MISGSNSRKLAIKYEKGELTDKTLAEIEWTPKHVDSRTGSKKYK